jgi:DNA-binding NtrC family response regulator
LTLHCPALREREGDVRLLAEAFLKKHRFSDAAIKRLEAYAWPGNIRELKNACDRCAVLADGDVIDVDALPLEIRLGAGATPSDTGEVKTLKQMERVMVIKALDATGGNRTKAAKLLGITYPTLKKKIDEFGVG